MKPSNLEVETADQTETDQSNQFISQYVNMSKRERSLRNHTRSKLSTNYL